MTVQTKKWVHGLVATLIVGTATAIDSGLVLNLVAPEAFNVDAKLTRTLFTIGVLGILSGLKGAFAYLKQSPLPVEDAAVEK